MKVYDQLLEVIGPATAETIRSSVLKNNPVLLAIAAVGMLGFLMLIWTSLAADDYPVLERLTGAILGATLYAFWTARSFLRDGTFSRRFTQDYVIRFGLGIVAGFILGSILGGGTSGAAETNTTASAMQQFGPFTLAVVGGFSAEAVVQILQRIAEVLVTTIRGSDHDQVKIAADKIAGKKLNKTAADLHQALQAGSSEEVSKRVEEIAQKLLKDQG
jgi:hypothetical protein